MDKVSLRRQFVDLTVVMTPPGFGPQGMNIGNDYWKGTKMRLFRVKNFAADKDGAVTVDWVVLTAAIVGIAIAVISTIKGGVDAAATDISNALTAVLT